MTLFTIACEKCAKGWQSPVPQEVCGRCGTLCTERGSYKVVELRK